MRRLFLFLLVLCGVVSTASATTLTGTINLPNSSGVNGQIRFSLSQQTAQLTTGSCGGPAVLAPTTEIAFAVTAGSLPVGATLVGNDCMNPSQTYYIVRLLDTNGNILFTQNWQVTGTSINIGTISPIATPSGSVTYGTVYTTNLVITGSCTFAGSTCGSGVGGVCGTLTANQILFGTSMITCATSSQLGYNPGTNTITFSGTWAGSPTFPSGITSNGVSPSSAGAYGIGGATVPYLNILLGSASGQYSSVGSAATTARTILFPDASGTLCLTTTCTGSISGLTTGFIPLAGSATSISGNSHCDDGVTTAGTVTCSEPITANSVSTTAPCNTGTTGCLKLVQGTAPTSLDANTITEYAPTSVTAYGIAKPGTIATGVLHCVVVSSTCTQSFSAVVSTDVDGSIGNKTTGTFSTLSDGTTVTWAIASAYEANAGLTFTAHSGSRTLNLTGLVNGGTYVLWLKQDGTGGEGLTLGSGCTWKVANGGGGAVTLSTGAAAIDTLAFIYDGGNCLAFFNKNFN